MANRPTYHAEVLIEFRPDCGPLVDDEEGGEPRHAQFKAYRQASLQIQPNAPGLMCVDEQEGPRTFYHWDDVVRVEIVDSKIETPEKVTH